MIRQSIPFCLTLFLGLQLFASAAFPGDTLAHLRADGGLVEWLPQAEYGRLVLTVSGPAGFYFRRELAAGQTPSFGLFNQNGQRLADGSYIYELRAAPGLPQELREQLRAARERGDDAAVLRLQGEIPGPLVQTGSFRIAGGAVLTAEESEREGGSHLKDQMVPDDLVVDGKGCIGLGCANGESFGAEALRLKQSVVRLRFEDTSGAGGFPTRDWQVTVNDPGSGGGDRFSIEDLTAGRAPFTLRGNAPADALVIDTTGKVGLRTATPAQDVHIASGNTPALRLEQTTGGGFPGRTWDVTASDTAFAVKDVTGMKTPLQLQPGAPTDSVYLSTAGNLGLGTSTPTVPFHVVRNTGALANLLRLTNNGGIQFLLERTDGNDWQFSNFNQSFQISVPGSSPGQLTLVSNGDLQIGNRVFAVGFVTTSAREAKEGFSPVQGREILSRLAAMPLTEWSFRSDPERRRHIGPVAEDFQAAFGLGQEGQGLSLTDVNGVTIAALQGLHAQVEEQRRTIGKQQELIRQLEERLARLEGQR